MQLQLYHELQDNARKNPFIWQDKKKRNLLISDSYKRLGFLERSQKIKYCGSQLEFKRFEDDSFKLHLANFCKARLCPMCAWRRTLKLYSQLSTVISKLDRNKYDILFMTLTIKNCSGDELKDTISHLFQSYARFLQLKRIKGSFKGFFRALEVTHNLDILSKSYDTYHPHIHCLVIVESDYFNNISRLNKYISNDELARIWQTCLRVDYLPQTDIRKVKNAKALKEVSKYTVKDKDFIVEDEEMTDSAVMYLDEALRGRRLVAYSGILKDIYKMLKLDDAIDGDLVHTEVDNISDELKFVLERYRWHFGYKQYYKLDEQNEFLFDN